MWGQPSLTFTGHEHRVPFSVDRSFEDVDVASYDVIIVPSGIVSDRLRYTDDVNKLKPKGVYGRVVLLGDAASNGTRLSLLSVTCGDGRTLEGKTVFGSTLRVPLDRLKDAMEDWFKRKSYIPKEQELVMEELPAGGQRKADA